MQGNKEHWEKLCALAAQEQDPEHLPLLVREINALLEAKERRLIELKKRKQTPPDQSEQKF